MTATSGIARVLERLKAILAYVLLLVAAGYLYRVADHFAYAPKPGELGPDFWPKAILVLLMLVCAFELLYRVLFSRSAQTAVTVAPDAEEGAEKPARYPHLLLGGIALSIAYVLVLDYAGFFVTTALYLALFMMIGRYRRYAVIAATSVLGSLAFIFVFMKIVYVSLPLGIGPFKQLSVWILALLGIR